MWDIVLEHYTHNWLKIILILSLRIQISALATATKILPLYKEEYLKTSWILTVRKDKYKWTFASEVKGDKELRRMPCCTKQH